jgi:hypothetical protein
MGELSDARLLHTQNNIIQKKADKEGTNGIRTHDPGFKQIKSHMSDRAAVIMNNPF